MTDSSVDFYLARMAIVEASAFISAPHTRMRPKLFLDGDKYCALYGDNLHDGCAGFGSSPATAMADFDRNWEKQISAALGEGNDA